jgi:hypothetical protein
MIDPIDPLDQLRALYPDVCIGIDKTPLLDTTAIVPVEKLSVEQIAKLYRVPYWLIDACPVPAWWRRPIWRFRAWRWSR